MTRLRSAASRTLVVLAIGAATVAHAAAPAERAVFIGDTYGELTVGTDGRATALRVDPRDLGDATLGAIGANVAKWEFEPVPAPVRVRAQFFLKAEELGDGNVRVTVEDALFRALPGADGRPAVDPAFAPPPMVGAAAAARTGAEVVVALRVGSDGRPQAVAVEEMTLLGPRPATGKRGPLAEALASAIEHSARQWKVYGPHGDVLRYPYTLKVRFEDGHDRQVRTPVQRPVPDWLQAARDEGRVHDVESEVPSDLRGVTYPKWAVTSGAGAIVMVAVQAPDDRPVDVVVDHVWLLGRVEKLDKDAREARARLFAEHALEGARDWERIDTNGNGAAFVPFSFIPFDMTRGSWMRTHSVPFADPAWLAERRAPGIEGRGKHPPVKLLTKLPRWGREAPPPDALPSPQP